MPQWGTVSLVELAWTALALGGALNHTRLLIRFRVRKAALRADPVRRPVAECLATAQVRTEVSRLTIKLLWTVLGLWAMATAAGSDVFSLSASLVLLASLALLDLNSWQDVRDFDTMKRLAEHERTAPDVRALGREQLDDIIEGMDDAQLRRLRVRFAKLQARERREHEQRERGST